MVHARLRDLGIPPQLGLFQIPAEPVKPRRVNGKVVRRELDGHLARADIAHWPHSLRPAGLQPVEGGSPTTHGPTCVHTLRVRQGAYRRFQYCREPVERMPYQRIWPQTR